MSAFKAMRGFTAKAKYFYLLVKYLRQISKEGNFDEQKLLKIAMDIAKALGTKDHVLTSAIFKDLDRFSKRV